MKSDNNSTAGLPVFDVYGYRFAVRGRPSPAVDGILQDFTYFRSESGAPEVLVELIEGAPDYASLPECDAAVYTPRNVVYHLSGKRYLDYGGRGLGIYDPAAGKFTIQSADSDLLYEAVYLFLLSNIGEFLDRRKLHRLHSLAVSIAGRAILVPLPMGGGKSTLGAALLRYPEVKILSDDSPFIDETGQVRAFPLRVALLKGFADEIPSDQRREIRRMEFGPKIVANFSFIADRVVDSADPGLLLLGRRSLSPRCRIEPASTLDGLRSMIADCVVGLGLYQGLEFLLRRSPAELLAKAGVGASRLQNCIALLRRSAVYNLHLGHDSEANARAIIELAHRTFDSSG